MIHIYNDVCIYNVESQQEYPVISTTISKYVCASSARFFTCSVNHYSERSINKELIDLSYWLTRVWVMHSEREIQPEWAYGWAWAASDQPLWHPKMASLVNPYWAVMALALLTKKLRHVQNPSHSSHSNQRVKFRRGYPISTHPALDQRPRAALVPPCGNGNEPCWPWANRVDKAKHLPQPHRISTDEKNMSPRLDLYIF